MTAPAQATPPARRQGRGMPLVLLHSLGVDSSVWAPVEQALDPVIRTITYDLPGHGRAPVPAAPYRLEHAAQQLISVLEEEREPCFVLGVSLGGTVALLAAALRPELFRGLVLVDCVDIYPDGLKQQWRDRAVSVPRDGIGAVVEPTLNLFFTQSYLAAGGSAVGPVRRLLASMDPEGYARSCEALEHVDARKSVSKISVPTLIVCGDEDAPPFIDAATRFARSIPKAELRWLSPARHAGVLEHPKEFAEMVNEFVLARAEQS